MLPLWSRVRSTMRVSLGADLRSTFDLLGNVITLLVVLTAVWAIAAGFLQAARLIQYIPGGLPGEGTGYWAARTHWLGPLLAVPVYALKAFGVTMLLWLAAAMVGGLLGFLFGVPRPAIGATLPAAASTGEQVFSPGSGAQLAPEGSRGGAPPPPDRCQRRDP
jgi:hypothetical protein